ncbi:HPr family phosphocarrier protein [Clostridium sp. AF18-27]|uniref:Catabolite repression HPr-like protein n=1 Tax=Enterocloster lavalensis TaxID=460384 RepID=A0A1I0CRM5_9FIRM|nr:MULTISPECIES: HPr family phosphocarrier protein [Enterocloster]MBS5604301.1 HPr family phosphocarrier protein [Enterocloster asparagiformis]RHR57736.1 HPr family phosphocarrier protein [Clostridium sp. AF18-27]MCB6347042.1 HPr family phosphocarrier protein [Enterocloster lavalensis]MDR3756017.1 HPr family phosphocarrier protein [Enterocloster sp.]PST31521.1 HPr family phosphocarrier protein [Enterocloster lavalensis]
MLKKVITIEGQNSSEAKPVAMLVQVASQYESTIYLETGSKRVNAKSIMGMMTLALMEGMDILVEADGNDETAAVSEIEKYLNNQ